MVIQLKKKQESKQELHKQRVVVVYEHTVTTK